MVATEEISHYKHIVCSEKPMQKIPFQRKFKILKEHHTFRSNYRPKRNKLFFPGWIWREKNVISLSSFSSSYLHCMKYNPYKQLEYFICTEVEQTALNTAKWKSSRAMHEIQYFKTQSNPIHILKQYSWRKVSRQNISESR